MRVNACRINAGKRPPALASQRKRTSRAHLCAQPVAAAEPPVVGRLIAQVGVKFRVLFCQSVVLETGLIRVPHRVQLALHFLRRHVADFHPRSQGWMFRELLCFRLFQSLDRSVHFAQPMIAELTADYRFELLDFRAVQVLQSGRVDVRDRRTAAHHDAVEAVEILLADRVEFMIVAARARNGEPQHRLRHDVDLVVGKSDLLVVCIRHPKSMRHHAQLCRADGGFIDAEFGVDARLFQKVASQVFADQLVVGNIGTNRANKVVAILVRIRNRGVALAAVRLGVAIPIHPIPGPAFAVSGRL